MPMMLRRTGLICAAMMFASLAMTAQAQEPVADYRFDQRFTDSLGLAPPLLQLVPDDGEFVPAVLDGIDTTGHRFTGGAGLQLDVDGLLDAGTYTIAVIVALNDTDNYAKIVDTQALASDAGVYVVSRSLRLYPAPGPGGGNIATDQFRQLVITRDATGQARGYIDGAMVYDLDDSSLAHGGLSPERVLHFFRDDDDTDNLENSPGTVLRIRLFDAALDATAVAALETDRVGDILLRNGFE